jgi:hypothetical protein
LNCAASVAVAVVLVVDLVTAAAAVVVVIVVVADAVPVNDVAAQVCANISWALRATR